MHVRPWYEPRRSAVTMVTFGEAICASCVIAKLRKRTGKPEGAAMGRCMLGKMRVSISHVRILLYQFKKRETNGDGSCKNTTIVGFCQILLQWFAKQ